MLSQPMLKTSQVFNEHDIDCCWILEMQRLARSKHCHWFRLTFLLKSYARVIVLWSRKVAIKFKEQVAGKLSWHLTELRSEELSLSLSKYIATTLDKKGNAVLLLLKAVRWIINDLNISHPPTFIQSTELLMLMFQVIKLSYIIVHSAEKTMMKEVLWIIKERELIAEKFISALISLCWFQFSMDE